MNIIGFLKKIGLLKYGAEKGTGPLVGEFYGSDNNDRKEEAATPKESGETDGGKAAAGTGRAEK